MSAHVLSGLRLFGTPTFGIPNVATGFRHTCGSTRTLFVYVAWFMARVHIYPFTYLSANNNYYFPEINFRTKSIPAAAADTPPTLFTATYPSALAASPLPSILTISTEYVENVVKLPQNPTPASNFARGVNPKPVGTLLAADVPAVDDFALSAAAETTGVANTPPRMKDPKTLIPAVCQPVR